MLNLETASVLDLRNELKSLGGSARGNMSRTTLVARVEAARFERGLRGSAPPPEAPSTPSALPFLPAAPVVAPVVAPLSQSTNSVGGCSQEQVLKAVSSCVERGMEVAFSENCWTFKHGTRQDSGTMSQPIDNIKKCAELVCRPSVSAGRIGLAGKQVI